MKEITYRAITFSLLLIVVSVTVGQQATFYAYANEEGNQGNDSTSDIQEVAESEDKPEVILEDATEADEISNSEDVENSDEDTLADAELNLSESDTTEINLDEASETIAITDESEDIEMASSATESQDVVVASSTVQNASSSPSSQTPNLTLATTSTATSSLATSSQTVASSPAVIPNATTTAVASSTAATTTTTTIVTGTAVAAANVLNIVNTNLVNSTGEIIFSNLFEDQEGGLDFRNSSGTACEFLTCGNSNGVEVRLLNDVYIRNAIMLEAATGNNLIDGAENNVNGSIETGDAFAGLNLVNVANTNFIDSNYLLVTLNAFRNVYGDIVFPGFASFFGQQNSMNYAESTSSIYNEGLIENNLESETHTGDNYTESSNGSIISSGNANATSNIYNQLNSSLLGGNSVSILLRVHGSWLGEVFGMPESMSVTSGNDGYYYISDTGTANSARGASSVNASNTAAIHNDVSLRAVTGNNAVTGVENASIRTGNAYVGANLVNIANANVIGRNWTMAILNIFGDFEGNISFGQPDLWVGEQVEVPSTIKDGSVLNYVFTVINKGDAPATNVKLSDTYDTNHLQIIDSSQEYSQAGEGTLSWSVVNLAPGDAIEISYRARVVNTTPGTKITNTVKSTLRETDGNYIDNTDTATIETTQVLRSSGGGSSITRTHQSSSNDKEVSSRQAIEKVTVDRLTSLVTLAPDEYTAIQELVVRNPQNSYVKDVVLKDTLYGPNGELIKEEVWEIGDILPNEEITLRYEMDFADSAVGGLYTLSTVVLGAGGVEKIFANNGKIELLTMKEVEEVVSEVSNSLPQPLVLGAMIIEEDLTDSGEFLVSSLFSIPVAYAKNGEVTKQGGVLDKNEAFPLIILLVVLFGLGMYRYSVRRQFK